MGKFGGFEEIQAWQKARDITLRIYRVTENGKFAGDFGLRDQIRRAAVSVMANIAEGTVDEAISNSRISLISLGDPLTKYKAIAYSIRARLHRERRF